MIGQSNGLLDLRLENAHYHVGEMDQVFKVVVKAEKNL